MFVGMGTAGWIMWARSVDLAPHERKAWRVMALGLLSAATGVLLTATPVTFGVSVPAFGPMDIFFITTYVLLVAAICLLARAEAVGRDWVATLARRVRGRDRPDRPRLDLHRGETDGEHRPGSRLG